MGPHLYKNVMRTVIQRGGDSDTNAAIVGGMVGSILGFKNLPQEYLRVQLSLKLGIEPGIASRTHFYEPMTALINCLKLIRKIR